MSHIQKVSPNPVKLGRILIQIRIRGSRAYRGRLTPKVRKQKKGVKNYLKYLFNRLFKTRIWDSVPQTKGDFCIYFMNTFGVRRTIDVLYSESQPESEKIRTDPDPELQGLQGTSDTKSMKTKKRR